MDIITIFGREMVAATRRDRRRLQGERCGLALLLFAAVGGSFAAWLYWVGGVLDGGTMARIADSALLWSVFVQLGIAGSILMRGALSIVSERERRTLDHLLVTRLSSAGIVLGKLGACVAMSLSMAAAGLPIVLLIHALGGVDLRWIGLAYAALVVIDLFLCALAIWISAEATDRRAAALLFTLGVMAWMIGPFSVAVLSPRLGLRLPGWLAAANWWLAGSSPTVIAFHIVLGMTSWDQLAGEVGRMIAFLLAGTVLFAVAAIARLRPAHRALGGVDRKAERRARRRLVWRWRPRPPVGDDPILWREMYTSRDNSLVRVATRVIFGGLAIGLAAGTFVYARPAFVEVWRHGYGSAAVAGPAESPPVLVRLFGIKAGANGPADIARTEFNLFIRYATVMIVLTLCFLVAGGSSEAVGVERARGTWGSLLATPLSARDILRAAVLAGVSRARHAFAATLILWTLGLAAGAVHPLGFVVSLLELVAATGMMTTLGVLGAIRAPTDDLAPDHGVGPTLLFAATGALVMLPPAGFNPVLLGAGSLPMMTWTSLVSYREMAGAMADPLNPHFVWAGFPSGQMSMIVFAACLTATVGPTAIGARAWLYLLTHFDRLVGRPDRSAAELPAIPRSTGRLVPRPAVPLPRRGSPLAEADGAV